MQRSTNTREILRMNEPPFPGYRDTLYVLAAVELGLLGALVLLSSEERGSGGVDPLVDVIRIVLLVSFCVLPFSVAWLRKRSATNAATKRLNQQAEHAEEMSNHFKTLIRQLSNEGGLGPRLQNLEGELKKLDALEERLAAMAGQIQVLLDVMLKSPNRT